MVKTVAPAFFFSSRRRHTRSVSAFLLEPLFRSDFIVEASTMKSRRGFAIQRLMNAMRQAHADEIGRASCRERVWNSVVAGFVLKEAKGHVLISSVMCMVAANGHVCACVVYLEIV